MENIKELIEKCKKEIVQVNKEIEYNSGIIEKASGILETCKKMNDLLNENLIRCHQIISRCMECEAIEAKRTSLPMLSYN